MSQMCNDHINHTPPGTAEKMGLTVNDVVLNIDKAPFDKYFTVMKFRDIEPAHSIEVMQSDSSKTHYACIGGIVNC